MLYRTPETGGLQKTLWLCGCGQASTTAASSINVDGRSRMLLGCRRGQREASRAAAYLPCLTFLEQRPSSSRRPLSQRTPPAEPHSPFNWGRQASLKFSSPEALRQTFCGKHWRHSMAVKCGLQTRKLWCRNCRRRWPWPHAACKASEHRQRAVF